MNPFKRITDWKRTDFSPTPQGEELRKRQTAEVETLHDLQKPIQQLLCDAHEEALTGSIVGVNKRMVALLAVTAYETRLTNWWLKALTVVIAIGTILLVLIEFCPHNASWKESCAHQNGQ